MTNPCMTFFFFFCVCVLTECGQIMGGALHGKIFILETKIGRGAISGRESSLVQSFCVNLVYTLTLPI